MSEGGLYENPVSPRRGVFGAERGPVGDTKVGGRLFRFRISTPTVSFSQPRVRALRPTPWENGKQKDFDSEGVVPTENAVNDTFGVEYPWHRRPGVSLAKPRSTPGCENDTFSVEEWCD